MQPFLHPYNDAHKIWSRFGQLISEIFKFESVDNYGPLVYYKLTLWAFKFKSVKFWSLKGK